MARRKPKLCRNKKVKKTCPNACDACRFKCADSPLPFYLKASATNTKSCWRIAKQSPEKIKNLCARPKIRNTCRKTCEVCGVDATVINFDEAEINDTAEYYRTDLQLENWWSTTGRTEYYNTGYMYGTKSEPNVGFNGWGRPITMTCPGGSFSFISSWMTPAWADGLSVTIIGSSGGVEKGRYSTNLSTTTNPVLIEGLNPAYFTDIDELVIESSPSQVVMDDMMIKIISPCTVTRVEADPNADGAGAMADPLMV